MRHNTFLALVILALLWGPGAMLIKIAVHDIPPLTLSAARLSIAALILYTVLKAQRHSLPSTRSDWKHLAIMAVIANALPYTLFSWAEQFIDSSLAAIFLGTVPLFTMIMAHLSTTDDRLTRSKSTGVLLGFGGMVILITPALFNGVQATIWGLVAAAFAAVSSALAIVYARQHLRGLPPLVGPTSQLGLAALFLGPLALVVERPFSLPHPSGTALAALVALAVVSTALAFIMYYRLMETTSATSMSMVTYMIPIVSIILGVVVLQERPGWNVYLGFGLIIIGVMIVNNVLHTTRAPALAGSHAGPCP